MAAEEIAKRMEALDFTLNFLVNRISPDQNRYFRTLLDMYFDLQEKMEAIGE
ncbi:MAG: hypothetical protein HFI97_01535 [Lachnospiraceae bacterium]|jgi:hypothetical protein|nr:hypothetical protein [Lachnospiraceae bacterium]MCI9202375.1 hypothetical protein [Lachnospiraceae bacterium]